ncbi:MAG TPA: isochorismatase family protein [Mycobacteriales bacterium]
MSAPVQALVVVDMQRGLLDGPHAVVGAAPLTERVEELVGRATAAGVVVVQLQNDGASGEVDEPGRPGWALALTGGTVIRKSADDGFAEAPLGELLAQRRVRRLAVCGVLSEMCVSATTRGALARGLGVVLPRDGHGTYDLDDIPAAVVARVAEHALGDQPELVASTTDVVFGH